MLDKVYGDIGLLKCDPVKTELKEDAEPHVVTTPSFFSTTKSGDQTEVRGH